MSDEYLEDQEDGEGLPWRTGVPKKKAKTKWVARNLMAYSYVAMIVGRGGSGKTLSLLSMAAQVQGGPRVFDGDKVEPQNVLWYSQDDDDALDVIPRLVAVGGNPDLLIRPDMDAEAMDIRLLCFPDGEKRAIRLIRERNIGLFIIDIASDFLCDGKKSYSPIDVGEFILSLSRVGRQTGAGVGISVHETKDFHGPAIEAAAGTAAWGNRVRLGSRALQDENDKSKFYLAIFKPGPGGRFVTYAIHSELVGECPRIVKVVESDQSAEDLGRKQEEAGKKTAIEEAKKFLLDFLKSEPMHVNDVSKAGMERAKVDVTILRTALTQLGGYPHPHRVNLVNHSYWHLPDVPCSKCKEGRRRQKETSPVSQ